MEARLTLHFLDGSSESFVLTAGDMMRFQKKYGQRALSLPPEQLTIDQQLFLAWSAAKRTGSTTLELVDWLDTVTGSEEG
jgi:hypothetical protein